MNPRIGHLLVLSTALVALAVGCQGKPSDDADNLKPLSPEEAAKYRQVTVHVTGMT